MIIRVCANPEALGAAAARQTAQLLRDAIAECGTARIVLSTGASQFATLDHLSREDVDWSRVEMFHLDEYIGLPENHRASFQKYLKERFVDKVRGIKPHYVTGDPVHAAKVGALLQSGPIHVGLIGIGQNTHIAFNDPPADFETEEPYIVVSLDERCKAQQVQEGWFRTVDEVPKQAVTMSVRQILRCEAILSCVPYPEKAEAVQRTLLSGVDARVPASILKTHKNFTLYADRDSFARVEPAKIVPGGPDMPVALEYTPNPQRI